MISFRAAATRVSSFQGMATVGWDEVAGYIVAAGSDSAAATGAGSAVTTGGARGGPCPSGRQSHPTSESTVTAAIPNTSFVEGVMVQTPVSEVLSGSRP